tara:strand:- start:333 stop:1064 length:732 start_codon:yes stop_codon:yes gene_type:complete
MNAKFVRILNEIPGVLLTKTQLNQFEYYYNELKVWNNKMNLTGSTDQQVIYFDHFLDSVFPAYAYEGIFSSEINVLDVGTGAGFPGLPIKILFPKIRICLLDSIGKRTKFLTHIISSLGLENVNIVNSRAEAAAHTKIFREQFDIVLSRAVAKLQMLSEITIPFVKLGGTCIFFKGNNPQEEIIESEGSISVLGGKISGIYLKPEDENFLFRGSLIRVAKQIKTPESFPRKSWNLKNKPLGFE